MNSRFAVALHALALLALRAGQPVSSDLVASSVNTNPVVIRRLMGLLSASGLVTVQAGRRGGAMLLRSPEKISLLDIYHAVEERTVMRVHEDTNPDCPVGSSVCRILATYTADAEEAFAGYLRSRTLADFVRDVKEAIAS
ncbi:MAG: Rrf2 family transcriptional regulator [Acidobacteria bacterium]|nr:Rrf2 family transcriptional regulator [Acidobacteriota bacterium]